MKPKPRDIEAFFVVAIGTFVTIGTFVAIGTFIAIGTFVANL